MLDPRAQNLRQGIIMKTSFKTRVLRMGLGSFVDINIPVSSYSPFFSNLSNQNLQNVKTPKRILKGFVQRYSFKFRALGVRVISLFLNKYQNIFTVYTIFMGRGREPPDTMSLRYADMSLPDLLGRPSLCYAVMSMRNKSKCACVIQVVF